MGIKDEILKSAGKDPKEIKIINALKKCFYAEHKPDEEARMVKMIQLKNGESRERIGLHGSAVLKDDICYRAQVLSLLFKQSQGEELPLETLAIFEEGNAIHEKWQRLFIRGGLGNAEDMDRTRFAQGYELLYTPDAVINIGGKQYVVEIKSMNTFSYKQNNEHPTGGKQCLLYMYLCNIHSGFVLMEDKNTQEFKIQIVKYDENEINLIIERLKEIQKLKAEFLDTKKPPKRICENTDCKQAENCFMRDCCFNIGMGRKPLYDKDDLIYKVMKSHIGINGATSNFYAENKNKKDLAEFLKKQYGVGGASGSGIIDIIQYNPKGFEISCKRMHGDKCEVIKYNYSWNEVAEAVIKIIEDDTNAKTD